MPKVMVIVPTASRIKTETEQSVNRLRADEMMVFPCNPIHEHENHYVQLYRNATHTRNQARQKALKSDCTHFLWIDSDVVPPDNTIHELLKMETESAGGWYPVRDGEQILEGRWVAGTFTEEGHFSNYHFPWVVKDGDPETHPFGDLVMDIRTKKFRREPTISHLAPLGCLMITRDVLELLEFEDGTNQSCHLAGYDVDTMRGDCLQFGVQLLGLGVVTHMSPRVLCQHIA